MPAAVDPRLAQPAVLEMLAAIAEVERQGLARRAQAGQAASSALPADDDALWTYVYNKWGIAIPRVAQCPGHSSQFQAFADAYFGRDSMIVWEASRGFGGKSFLLSTLGLTIATTRGGDVNILAGSGEQSKRVHDYMAAAWDRPQAPRHLLRSDPFAMRTKLAHGNTIQALLASSTSVRGPHIPTLLMDECDEMALPIFDAAMGQTMAKPGLPAVTVMSSTHHYPSGTMTEIKRRATEKGWLTHTWCYREALSPHGWLEPEQVERKQRETTAAMWLAEYELQEPSTENRAIDPDAVTACFRGMPGTYAGAPREYVEAEPPQDGARYAHGADWARKTDWTEIVSLRCEALPYKIVAYERMQRLPWPQMVGRLDARILCYGGRAAHDGTGLGDVVGGYMTQDADAIMLVGRARADLFSECIAGIERGDIVSPCIVSLEGQLRYCTVDDLYGTGHPPDGFVALALAYRAAQTRLKRAGVW